jgi:hypothetical protein
MKVSDMVIVQLEYANDIIVNILTDMTTLAIPTNNFMKRLNLDSLFLVNLVQRTINIIGMKIVWVKLFEHT